MGCGSERVVVADGDDVVGVDCRWIGVKRTRVKRRSRGRAGPCWCFRGVNGVHVAWRLAAGWVMVMMVRQSARRCGRVMRMLLLCRSKGLWAPYSFV